MLACQHCWKWVEAMTFISSGIIAASDISAPGQSGEAWKLVHLVYGTKRQRSQLRAKRKWPINCRAKSTRKEEWTRRLVKLWNTPLQDYRNALNRVYFVIIES
jgi:hypothetical protein